MGTTKKVYTSEYCKYDFTEDDKKEIAQKMAMKTLESGELEQQKKSVMTGFKNKIEAADLVARECANHLKDGYEMRSIECEVIRDYDDGVIRYVRVDNGECVRTDDITHEERQMHIDELLKMREHAADKCANEDFEDAEILQIEDNGDQEGAEVGES